MSASLPDSFYLSRLTFGIKPDTESSGAKAQGLRTWLAEQLAAPQEDDPACQERLKQTQLRLRYDAGKLPSGQDYPAVDEMRALSSLESDISDLWSLTDYKRPMSRVERVRPRMEVAAACLTRAVYSQWQLRELMVDFWHNHFNVDAGDAVQVAVALPAYDRDVIRRHALGNFREFLEAVASSTAMLYYLNNRSSRAGKANENYARELFELHTFGREHYLNNIYDKWRNVPGALKGQPEGFIDQDVYEAARAFTGWAVADGSSLGGNDRLPQTGRFTYVESWHDGYQKRVLGAEFDAFLGPLADGKKVLDLVAAHPATARHLSAKLCQRLVGNAVTPKLLKAASAQWTLHLKRPDQIARVIEFIVLSPEFSRSKGTRVRRPLELVAAFARATRMDFTPTEGLVNEMASAGQRLFAWAPPTGHPEETDYWLSTNGMRRRWRLVQGLANNQWGNGVMDPQPSSSELNARTVGQIADHWAERLLGASPGSDEARIILNGMGINSDKLLNSPQTIEAASQLRQIVSYLAMSPAFQSV